MLALIIAVVILLYILLVNRSWFLRTPSYTKLNKQMRRLWSDHVHWTREYLLLTVEDATSRQYTANRLLKNQVDIGDMFAKFYGAADGAKLTALLQEHINQASKIIDTMRGGNNPDKLLTDWYHNADDIGEYLRAHNPHYWAHAKDMMHMHLDATVAEVSSYINAKRGVGDANLNTKGEDIIHFEKVLDQSLLMADILTDGIVTQSPFLFLF